MQALRAEVAPEETASCTADNAAAEESSSYGCLDNSLALEGASAYKILVRSQARPAREAMPPQSERTSRSPFPVVAGWLHSARWRQADQGCWERAVGHQDRKLEGEAVPKASRQVRSSSAKLRMEKTCRVPS